MTRTPTKTANHREPSRRAPSRPAAAPQTPHQAPTHREGWPLGISDQEAREMLRGCGLDPALLSAAARSRHQRQRADLEAAQRERSTPKAQRPRCGARTRKGTPCAARVLVRADGSPATRCRNHGGASTGPRSKAGREAIAASNRRRAREAAKIDAQAKA